VVVNYIREAQIAAGVPRDQVYDLTMYILCGMLVLGLVCNLFVRPVSSRWLMSEKELAALHVGARPAGNEIRGSFRIGRGRFDMPCALAWLAVGLPILWGTWITLRSALALFR
jgi:hypothetical protein